MPCYTFDLRLFATVSLDAPDEAAARAMIRAELDGADCNGGCWPNGDPILFTVGLDDRATGDLMDINGEAV